MSLTTGLAKVLFYGYMCIQNYENVEFTTNTPTRHETILDSTELKLSKKSAYFNIFKNGDGYDLIFRNRMWWLKPATCLYNTEEKSVVNLFEDKYFLNHNFCVIKSKCGTKYYGIGGEHATAQLARSKRQNQENNEPKICVRGTYIVSPEVFSEYHHNGLYLMQSKDLHNWEYVKKLPVLSGVSPGQTDPKWGYSRFDSKISCFYSEILEKYVLFIRANMGMHLRWVQIAQSSNLVDWEPFQPLKMPGVDFKNHNYYHLDVMEYPEANVFIGLAPYWNKQIHPTEIGIKLMFSRDGINWIDRGIILDAPVSANGLRSSIHSTSVFFDRGDYYDMFFNENYNGILDPKKSITVVNYRIPRDRLVGIKSNGVGSFAFKVKVRSDTMELNYDCLDTGYLKLKINGDGDGYTLQGDHLHKKIKIDEKYMDQDVLVEVEMRDCTLYACET